PDGGLQAVPAPRAVAQVGAAIWIYVDGAAMGATSSITQSVTGYSWILIVCSILAYLMINAMAWSQLIDEDSGTTTRARLFLIVAVVIQLVVLCMGGFVLGTVYLSKEHSGMVDAWGGVSIFVSNLLIALACWGQRLATLPPKDDSSIGLL
ncbi:unnamed protein product, partial [Symbiodinium sp. KB8]